MSCGKIFLIFVAIIFICTLSFVAWFWYNLKAPVAKAAQVKSIVIKSGQSADEIAQKFKEKGLIKSIFVFKVYGMLSDSLSHIQAGEFEITSDLNIPALFDLITSNQEIERKFRVIEGWSLKDIAEEVKKNNVCQYDEFIMLTGKDSPYKSKYNFLQNLSQDATLEGFLFPDTYIYNSETACEELINMMLNNFDERIMQKYSEAIKSSKKSIYEIVTMASIVEREAKKEEDRPKIASVYYNRLSRGIKLQADPTIQYAKGSWKEISAEDYQYDSIYNTYLHEGLPPGPICNMGNNSVKSAIQPANTDYLFFFHLKDGTTIYSKTAQEHSLMLEQYRNQM